VGFTYATPVLTRKRLHRRRLEALRAQVRRRRRRRLLADFSHGRRCWHHLQVADPSGQRLGLRCHELQGSASDEQGDWKQAGEGRPQGGQKAARVFLRERQGCRRPRHPCWRPTGQVCGPHQGHREPVSTRAGIPDLIENSLRFEISVCLIMLWSRYVNYGSNRSQRYRLNVTEGKFLDGIQCLKELVVSECVHPCVCNV
jgi:hypothetical protein